MNHILTAFLILPFLFVVLVILYSVALNIYRRSKRGRNEPPW